MPSTPPSNRPETDALKRCPGGKSPTRQGSAYRPRPSAGLGVWASSRRPEKAEASGREEETGRLAGGSENGAYRDRTGDLRLVKSVPGARTFEYERPEAPPLAVAGRLRLDRRTGEARERPGSRQARPEPVDAPGRI
jgi:hypothetical protein